MRISVNHFRATVTFPNCSDVWVHSFLVAIRHIFFFLLRSSRIIPRVGKDPLLVLGVAPFTDAQIIKIRTVFTIELPKNKYEKV